MYIVLWIWTTLLVVQISAQSSRPCLPQNRISSSASCLRRITDALYSKTEFFFGQQLDSTCDSTAQNNPDNVNCFTDDESNRRLTLASRILPNGIKTEGIDRYLDVSFSTSAGKYNACGGNFLIEQRTTDVNPDMNPTQPVYVRESPTFSMNRDRDAYYTIIVMDAGYGYVHGFFKDYPETKDVVPFKKPLNFRNVTNVFAFLVYRQPDRDYMVEPRWLPLLSQPSMAKKFTLEQFATDHGLTGPVAVNWMLVNRDPWAVQQVLTMDHDNNYCITLDQEALRTSGLAVVDQFTTIDSYFKVLYNTRPLSYQACCQQQFSNSTTANFSPLANASAPSVTLRETPSVGIEKSLLHSSNNRKSEGLLRFLRCISETSTAGSARKLTLLAVDFDLTDSSLVLPSKPFLNWLITNVDEDTLTNPLPHPSLPYLEPVPSLQSHRLVFLAFEQDGSSKSTADASQFSDSHACPKDYAGRCLFDLNQFVTTNRLTLRAFNWITVKPDPYTWANLVRRGESQDAICQSVPGYKSCQGSKTGETTPRTTSPSGRATGMGCAVSVWLFLLGLQWFLR